MIILPFISSTIYIGFAAKWIKTIGDWVLCCSHVSKCSFFTYIFYLSIFICLCWVLVASGRIWFPDQGSNPGPLYFEFRILALGPSAKSHKQMFLFHIFKYFYWIFRVGVKNALSLKLPILVAHTKVFCDCVQSCLKMVTTHMKANSWK